MDTTIITLVVFFIIILGLAAAIGFSQKANTRKMILADAESKGWKNIKIKMGWCDFIVIYQDKNGKQGKTHYSSYFDKIIWREDTKSLFLSKEEFKAKPDQPAPKEGKEFLVLNLKIKNIIRKVSSPWSFHIITERIMHFLTFPLPQTLFEIVIL